MDRPLLLAHRRKLILGSSVLAVSALLCLFAEPISRLIAVSSWYLELAGALTFIVLLYWLAQGLKCPGCRVNLFWYALGHAKSGNWLDWLLKQSVCPKCGHRESNEHASRTGQRA